MKKLTLALLIGLSAIFGTKAAGPDYHDEDLSYRVTYKWGLIHKQAGEANFKLKRHADNYSAILTARTQPWADRIFQVRDTLSGTMRLGDMAPILYVKSTMEKGTYRHDVIHYTYNHDNTITAKCSRYKKKKNQPAEHSDTVLNAPAPGTDMLSVYYLVRKLPFDSMKPGDVAYAKIFSGKKVEDLAVRYEGRETVKLDGISYPCYHIGFTFTSERMKNSSAPMQAWISTEGNRIPVKLIGELPVGKIQVLYNNPKAKK